MKRLNLIKKWLFMFGMFFLPIKYDENYSNTYFIKLMKLTEGE